MSGPFASPRSLYAGVVAPILFTGVYLVDGATRTGYDPLRHQVSLLSLGDRGWVQVLSFLVTGGLLLVFAGGFRAWLGGGTGARSAPFAIGMSGVGFIVAGIFTTQPMFGYPPGGPAGMPASVTTADIVHVIAAGMLFFGLIAAALVLAVRFWRSGARGWALVSATAAMVVLVCFGASGGGPSGDLLVPAYAGLLQRVALVAGLGWVLAIALHAVREPAPTAYSGR